MSNSRLACALACAVIPSVLYAQTQPKAATVSIADKSDGEKDGKKKDEPKPTVQVVRLSGTYADLPAEGLDPAALLLGGGGKQSAFYELTEKLEALAKIKSDDLVFFDLTRSAGLNGVQLRELERCMHKVRGAGRKTVAYLENATATQYQLAALCDKVYLANMGSIDLKSPSMTVTFMKDALDLLGVRPDIVRCGDFKGAVEPYMLPRMSDHLRKHYEVMLGKINADIVRRIAKARSLEPATVRTLQAQRLLRAEDALKAGLVDRLVPWDGAKKTLARILGTEDFKLVNALRSYKRRQAQGFLAVMDRMFSRRRKREKKLDSETIAVLHLSGGIVDGHSESPGSMVSGPTVAVIDKLAADDQVRGVVARINSPGGSATASEAIRRALVRLAKKKPLVYSMGRVAASGGYWITCTGRPILAEATTITGSIGVFGMKMNLGPLMRRVGMHEEIISLDRGADFDALSRAWPSELRGRMQNHVDDIYDRFLNQVAKSRRISRGDVERVASGRVWSGEQAKARGLVDSIGGLEDAIALVAKEAKIQSFETMHTPKAKGFMDTFMEQLFSSRGPFGDGVTRLALKRLGNLDTLLAVLVDALRNDSPARVWAVMPAQVRFQ